MDSWPSGHAQSPMRVRIWRGVGEPFDEADVLIDDGVQPLVRIMMDDPDIATIASCQGSADIPAMVTFRHRLGAHALFGYVAHLWRMQRDTTRDRISSLRIEWAASDGVDEPVGVLFMWPRAPGVW